ncbi:MAG: cation transporter [Bacillota bacterium]|nr:cation transporter [Bacillota bacterium]
MNTLSKEQSASREKTLLVALLLSMWAPLTTGIAVLLSHSTTQLADFIRRSVELIALFVSWCVFRYLARNKELDLKRKVRMEKIAGITVAAALTCSGIVMLLLALSRLSTFEPGGNVYPGIAIAVLGLITNSWFWRRYSRLTCEQYSSIIDAQRQLYRAKAYVDLCVIAALTAVALNPTHPVTRYIDILGSVILSVYLLWSGFRTAQAAVLNSNKSCPILEDK